MVTLFGQLDVALDADDPQDRQVEKLQDDLSVV